MTRKKRPCERLSHVCGEANVSGWCNLMICEMQCDLGCQDCRFSDERALGRGPCCTYPHGPEIENGKCVTRGLFAHA